MCIYYKNYMNKSRLLIFLFLLFVQISHSQLIKTGDEWGSTVFYIDGNKLKKRK